MNFYDFDFITRIALAISMFLGINAWFKAKSLSKQLEKQSKQLEELESKVVLAEIDIDLLIKHTEIFETDSKQENPSQISILLNTLYPFFVLRYAVNLRITQNHSVQITIRRITRHLQLKTDDYGELEYFCRTYKGKTKRSGVKLFKDNKAGVAKYLEYFKMMHPYYAPAICTGIGSTLQKKDSDYVMSVLRISNELGVPVLPVHDEFVFPESYLSIMKIVLQRAFQSTFKDIGTIGNLNLTVSSPNSDEEQLSIDLKV